MANYNPPWNKGLSKETDIRVKASSMKCSQTKKRMYKKGILKPWCKGLTKETNESLKIASEKISRIRLKLFKEKKIKNGFKGKSHSEKTKRLRSRQEKAYAKKNGGRTKGLKWTKTQKLNLSKVKKTLHKNHPEIIRKTECTKKKLFAMGKIKPPMLGKKHSAESRKKMRLSVIKRVEILTGLFIRPGIGIQETHILDTLEIEYGCEILRQYPVAGYFFDGYIPDLNLAIEVDEPHHFNSGKLKDIDIRRQKEIENELNCEFVRMEVG